MDAEGQLDSGRDCGKSGRNLHRKGHVVSVAANLGHGTGTGHSVLHVRVGDKSAKKAVSAGCRVHAAIGANKRRVDRVVENITDGRRVE